MCSSQQPVNFCPLRSDADVECYFIKAMQSQEDVGINSFSTRGFNSSTLIFPTHLDIRREEKMKVAEDINGEDDDLLLGEDLLNAFLQENDGIVNTDDCLSLFTNHAATFQAKKTRNGSSKIASDIHSLETKLIATMQKSAASRAVVQRMGSLSRGSIVAAAAIINKKINHLTLCHA